MSDSIEFQAKANRPAVDPTVADVLGQIVWLMTQSPKHQHLFISDLEWLVMPAILLKQFKIFKKGDLPVGVTLWARASDEVVERLDRGKNKLQLAEWRSGEQIVVVETIAPFGGGDEMIKTTIRDESAVAGS